MNSTIGIVGHGRIGTSIEERVADAPELSVEFVHDGRDAPTDDLLRNAVAADLVVEAADFRAVRDLGAPLLERTDLLVLSTAALADREVEDAVVSSARENGTTAYVPHGAILGTDGLQDARDALDEVSIETRKHPENLDFSFADGVDPGDVDSETTLYDGPTRAICDRFPRNVNSHATVALAGLGFDRTTSRLIADPAATAATHDVRATGDGTTLEARRVSDITGVTGEYTLESVWGTIERVLGDPSGLAIV